jgi:copper chaperone CopZ
MRSLSTVVAVTALSLSALLIGCANTHPRMGQELPAPRVGPVEPGVVVEPSVVVPAPEPEAPKNRLSEAYTIKVTGMTCRFVCVREVTEALKSVPGVSNVIIDFDEHKAIVHCALGTNPDDLMTALQASGKYSGIVLPN